MTTVRVAITVPTADGAGRRPTGNLSWSPTKRRNEAGDLILPAPFNAAVTDPPGTVEVAPTGAGWAWQVIERLTGGSPHKRILAVPDSAETVDYADLVEVDPATLDPVAEPEAAWWAALAALLPGGGGGVSVVDHGDGTFDLSGSSVTDNGDGTYSIAA